MQDTLTSHAPSTPEIETSSGVLDVLTGTFTLPTFSLLLAGLGLLFGIFQWWLGRRERRKLAGIICAAKLEQIARQCLQVAWDHGTWNDPRDPEVQDGDFNHVTTDYPDLPDFSNIESVPLLGTRVLNRLLALSVLQVSINRYIGYHFEDDQPDFWFGFNRRRIFYAGFGIYCIDLAANIRRQLWAAPMGTVVETDRRQLIKAMSDELHDYRVWRSKNASKRKGNDPYSVDRLKNDYEIHFLPEPESFWPTHREIEVPEETKPPMPRPNP